MALVTVQRSPSVAGSNSDGEAEDDEGSKNEKSECFFAGKDTALSLELKEIPQQMERRLSTDSTRSTNSTQSNNSDIQQHLQSMFYLIRNEETLKMAVKLESQRPNRTRYLVIASRCCYRTPTTDRKSKVMRNNSMRSTANTTLPATVTTTSITGASNQRQSIVDSSSNNNNNNSNLNRSHQLRQSQSEGAEVVERRERPQQTVSPAMCANRQSVKCDADRNAASGDSKCAEGIEESCLLGIDCNDRTTIGLVVPILADTTIHLDGDGGFSVTVYGKTHIFKPVSVQAMWSALQTLHKVSHKARENNFYPGGPSHDWLSYYENRIESDQSCLNEWNAMDSLESRRPPSPDAIRNKPTAKEETESVIKMKLKEIMMSVDLDEVTSKYIRGRLEELLDMDLGEYKSFIDAEMLLILGQMDAPTKIFEHVYLGSEWNASNLEELQKNGVRHILNVTREIDNFFPGMFDYFNVRVYDDEKTNLLKHWDNTYRYITRAKSENSKVLVHCKMGVSRSASVVIAYAMKAYNWKFHQALQHVKECRNCIKPNKNFLNQLETYNGILDAMKNKEKLQRSKSETNLKSTKDARLLPGSEPTPLIQALNQSKSKSAGQGVSGDESDGAIVDDGGGDLTMAPPIGGTIGCLTIQKQRRMIRRSSSTSPKSVQSQTTIVMKQQSQSLENLTPERSVADEPKNVRFPGSNGENYSVTQNQVLHIQKNTPITPMQPNSVRTIVHDLEAYTDARKSVDDRKTLNLQFGRSISQDTSAQPEVSSSSGGKGLGSPVWTSSAKLITQTSNIASQSHSELLLDAIPAPLRSSFRMRRGTNGSSSSDASDVFLRRLDKLPINDNLDKKRHSRKTQSWAATSGVSGGIVMDAPTAYSGINIIGSASTKLGSNNSMDSVSSAPTIASSSAATAAPYEGHIRTRNVRHRDIPLRHASWGSGDSRYGLPVRNSSWSSYDTNRNTFQYNSSTAPAIVEGQIHELNMSNKTAISTNVINISTTTATSTSNRTTISIGGEDQRNHPHHLGTVKRTKQKLEESSVLKKLCQENGDLENLGTDHLSSDRDPFSLQKCNSNLYRSASAAGSMRARYPYRCNSEEIMHSGTSMSLLQRGATRRSDGSKPLQSELFSASAPESYSMSDIENKNTLPPQETQHEDDESANVELRSSVTAAEDQRVSGNVQILKKNFEAKASVTSSSSQLQQSTVSKKGHQSLPSSPVAQHVDHSMQQQQITTATATLTTPALISSSFCDQQSKLNASASSANSYASSTTASSCSSSASSTSSSVSESSDRNVKGLVHKYQATTATVVGTLTTTTTTTSTTILAPIVTVFKSRSRSYYENQRIQKTTLSGKPHEFSDSRPPPAPVKSSTASNALAHLHSHPHPHNHQHNENKLQQQQHTQRRLQQHGKTHPLARLSLTKQSCNAAAFNTM